jgi:hypothetical protein
MKVQNIEQEQEQDTDETELVLYACLCLKDFSNRTKTSGGVK